MKKYFIVDVGRFTSMSGPSEEDLARVLEMARNPNWIVALYEPDTRPDDLVYIGELYKIPRFLVWGRAIDDEYNSPMYFSNDELIERYCEPGSVVQWMYD